MGFGKNLCRQGESGVVMAKELIEKIKPTWIDSPDQDGLWWFLSPDGTVSCATIIEILGKFYREERDTHIYNIFHVSSYIGKWQKIEVPEKE